MSWLNSYNSGNANTALPITTKSGYCLRGDTYATSSSTRYSTSEFATNNSNLTYIAAANIPTGWIRVKVYNPNKKKVHFVVTSTSQTGAKFPKVVQKVKIDGDYQYYYFNVDSTVSVYLCPVYSDHTETSGGHTYVYYYGLEIVEAVKAPAWDEKIIKIYDDGTSHLIPPTVYCDDNSGSSYQYWINYQLYAVRLWEVDKGGTYTMRCASNTGLTIKNLTSWDGNYVGASYNPSSSSYTTDPDTGEIVYTIKMGSARGVLMALYNGDASNLISQNPRLYGQRAAGWYDVDDYAMKTTWKDTTISEHS